MTSPIKNLGLFILTILSVLFAQNQLELIPREQYSIDLAKIALHFSDEQTEMPEYVRASFVNNDDYVTISTIDDAYVKNTRKGREKTVYRESFEKAYYLTDFEAKQISLVCKTLSTTLDDLEENLKDNKWERCVYLDSFFPKFLRGFYYLVNSAKNSTDAFSEESLVPESAFDVSMNSPKSDTRINYWRNTSDYVVKLRIITHELNYQIGLWQKNELTKKDRNPEISFIGKLDETMKMFVSIYFHKTIELAHSQKRK